MSHKPNSTQQERILAVLRAARDGTLKIPGEFLFHHPKGVGVSARYFHRNMGINQANARISELRAEGYNIESSKKEDMYGFRYQRLISEPGAQVVPKDVVAKPKFVVDYDYRKGRAVMRPAAA